MGNCCTVEGAVDHWIFVKTGDIKGGQAEVTLKVTLQDDRGKESETKTVNCYFGHDFEKGNCSTKDCHLAVDFGKVKLVRVERSDSDPSRNWFCEAVIVNDRRKGVCTYFPVLRWLRSNHKYVFYENDTFITQTDPCLHMDHDGRSPRATEIKERQELYQFGQMEYGVPLQVG